ncbi:MAG: DUF1801 domain-containing protein [Candidatus Nanopelagicales bacterium]
MAELKTKPNRDDVEAFLESVNGEQRRADAKDLCALMTRVTGEPPVMWGPSIVGFGHDHLVYASGRELDWMSIGFSPRKAALTLYLTCDLDRLAEPLAGLGKYTHGKGCLYIKKLADVDQVVLENLIEIAFANSGKAADE